MERVLEKSSATIYRFGPVADLNKSSIVTFEMLTDSNRDGLWSVEQWRRYLKPNKKNLVMPEIVLSGDDLKKPLKEQEAERARRFEEQQLERARLEDMIETLLHGGTEVYGSVRDVARAKSLNNVQAIIVISDGNSNLGSSEVLLELQHLVSMARQPIDIYTILVGNYRPPTEIRNLDVQTVETARPDDRFPLKVSVSATASLRDEPFNVCLEAIRKKDVLGQPLPAEKKYVFPARNGTFKGQGENPQGSIDYEIDLVQLVVNREQKERPDYRNTLLELMRFRLASEPVPIPTEGLKDDELKAKFIEVFGIGQWEYAAVRRLLEQHQIEIGGVKLDDLKKKFLDHFGVGEWEFTIDIPNTSESLSQRILVERPNLEMIDLRENPKAMWELATDAGPVLSRLDNETRAKIAADLQPLSDEINGGRQRLFFRLNKADNIPLCLFPKDSRKDEKKADPRKKDVKKEERKIDLPKAQPPDGPETSRCFNLPCSRPVYWQSCLIQNEGSRCTF